MPKDHIRPNQYALYLRKSRKDIEMEALGAGETLSRHRKTLLELASRMNCPITDIYAEVVSGESISARPQMQRLLVDVSAKKYKGVFVMEVERLARGDTKDQGEMAEVFRNSRTKIITPVKTYDPDSEFDEEYLEFGLFMSRREYKTFTRRLQRGRLASINDGLYIASSAPYGYERVKLPGKGYSLAIVEEAAQTIRLIYQLYTNGQLQENGSYQRLGTAAIARHLDQMHVPTPSGAPVWSKATVQDILKNPTYAGMIRWGHRKVHKEKNPDGSYSKRRHDTDDCPLVPGHHPAIIPMETYQTAAEIRERNRRLPTKKSPGEPSLQNPLSGICYCTKCGALMTRLGSSARNPYDALRCSNRYCDNVSAPIYLIERQLISFLSGWLEQYRLEHDCSVFIPADNQQEALRTAISSVRHEIKTAKTQLENTFTLLEQGVYSVEIFTQRNFALTEKISALELQLSDLLTQQESADKIIQLRDTFIPRVERVLNAYDRIDSASGKNDLLRTIIERIEYNKDTPNRRGQRENANFELKVWPKVPK